MRDQVFCGWNLKIISSYLKSAPWYLLSGYKISWKMQMPKLGAKNALFGYFPTGVWKTYCHTWNQRPWICLVAKFGTKLNILKFGTKNTWFGYFPVKILKQYCHIWDQHPRICLIAKLCKKKKQKGLNLGPKMPYLGIFELEF